MKEEVHREMIAVNMAKNVDKPSLNASAVERSEHMQDSDFLWRWSIH